MFLRNAARTAIWSGKGKTSSSQQVTEHHSQTMLPWFGDQRNIVVYDANGHYVQTNQGLLIDLNSGYWTTGLGHKNPSVRTALRNGYFSDLFRASHTAAEELAEELCRLFGYSKVVYTTSGSSAVDTAIRIAWQFSSMAFSGGKRGIVSVRGGYHGTTALALAVSGLNYGRFLGFNLPHFTIGKWFLNVNGDEKATAECLSEEQIDWDNCAAFLFEPVQGVGGIRPVGVTAYAHVAKRCRESGVLIIADEASCGLGRTGSLAASFELANKPDILCLGKMLTNGEFPLYAVLISEDVAQRIENSTHHLRDKYLYGETFAGHPTGCLLAKRVLKIVSEANFLEQVRQTGELIEVMLRQELDNLWCVHTTRGRGMMWGIELDSSNLAEEVVSILLTKGVRMLAEGNTLVLMPALTMPLKQISQCIRLIKDSIECAYRRGKSHSKIHSESL